MSSPSLSPGQRVGPYTVVAPLRSGGMASLYLARRMGPAGFARPVALKLVHTHLGKDPQFVRMFLDEALLCARIRHPNVVHVEELGEHEGAYYLAMEYVDGASLEDIIDRLCALGERLPARFAVSIACSLLEGLYAVHTLTGDLGEPLHVVHRDVSPSNTLIDRAGHVKLIDFGVAKARGRLVETSAGTLKGKYAYMSPEQAYGRPLDQRSDLYALAVMLWEMLTMRPLFVADTDLALLEVVRAPVVPPLGELAPDLPAALSVVMELALAPVPEARPASARELRRMLHAAMPEARSVDGAELAALIEHLFGPQNRAHDSAIPAPFALGSTVATPAPQQNEQLSPPAATQAGAEPDPRRSLTLLAAAALGALLLALGLWGWEHRGASSQQPAPAARTPLPAALAQPAAPVLPSLAAPPHVAAPAATAPPAALDVPAGGNESAASRVGSSRQRRRARAQAVREAESSQSKAAEPSAPRSQDMHGVPIVEKPAF